jgi:hypothetical protein
MTDEWNVAEDQDPQSAFLSFDDESDASVTPQALYERGLQQLAVSGYLLVRHQLGPYAYHYVYKRKEGRALPQIDGINYPPKFQAYVPLLTPEEIGFFEDKIANLPEPENEFWKPLAHPDPRRQKPIYAHTIKLLTADGERTKRDSNMAYELGISWDCSHKSPLKWIPKREWFAPEIQQLTFEEIFTIFPLAECEMLKLLIGRVCVGRNNNLPPGAEKPIQHTARMAGLIVGSDPGLGKSTIFKKLWSALGKVGYTQSTWNKPSDRFNLAEVITSDIIYKDDVCAKELRAFLESEKVKVLTTSGELRTEEKGINAMTTPCHGVLFMNANEVDPRMVYGLDPGIIARVHQIATYREAELATLKFAGVSADTPNVRPFNHLPWLAQRLRVSEDAILLWACRLSADEFYQSIDIDPTTGVNHLEQTTKRISSELRYSFHKMVTPQFLLLMYLTSLIPAISSQISYRVHMRKVCADRHWLMDDFTNTFKRIETLMTHKNWSFYRQAIKKHWEDLGRPEIHPYLALTNINVQTLQNAKQVYGEFVTEHCDSIGGLCEAFKRIHLINGFGLSHDRVWLNNAWETARFKHLDLVELVWQIRQEQENQENLEEVEKFLSILTAFTEGKNHE